jgi:superfamily II DNA or RNA helicase
MLKTPPRGNQAEAVKRALRFDGFLLFPEQRVGKTWISLAVVDARKPRKLLIICRKIGVKVWTDEIAKHLEFDWECDFKIRTHESFNPVQAKEIRKWLRQQRDRDSTMVIVDECHKIKKRGSRTSMTVRQIAKFYARYKLGLSGTPVGEGPENIWPQMDLVDKTVFGTYEEFGENFLRFGGYKGLKVVGYHNQDEYEGLISEHSFRETLQESRKIKYKVRTRLVKFELSPEVREIYDQLAEGLDVVVQRKKVKLKELMHSAMKCQQLAGGYLIRREDDDGERLPVPEVIPIHREKIRVLRRVMESHPDERLVIIARFKHELAAICKLCRKLGRTFEKVCGGSPYSGTFTTDVVVVQIASGISIDLSLATIAIFYSADYSFINNAQARSRILSYEQLIVTYYYLIAADTVDEDIYEAFRTKRKFSDVILDNRRRREKRS